MSTHRPTGVLLVQLGTPDAPTAKALRRYLREFLSDPRVVDINPWLWKPLLYTIILTFRPRKSAALYRRVWTEEGSPLRVYTEAQTEGVAKRLGDAYRVTHAMVLGTPTIASRLDELEAAGCEDIVVLPLYPQYSSATTASVFDRIARWSKGRRNLPTLHFVRSFPDHPAYIEALRQSVVETGIEPTVEAPLLMSFHGIPKRYADTGDPYPEECERTAAAVAASLGLADDAWQVVYQSRFGPETWLQPYADETVWELPEEGITSVSVATFSFVADCLETIDEIGRELREEFEEAGGEHYVRVPCINASDAACDAFAQIVRETLGR